MILFSKSWKSQSLTGSSTQLFSKYSSPRLSCAVANLPIPTLWFQLPLELQLVVLKVTVKAEVPATVCQSMSEILHSPVAKLNVADLDKHWEHKGWSAPSHALSEASIITSQQEATSASGWFSWVRFFGRLVRHWRRLECPNNGCEEYPSATPLLHLFFTSATPLLPLCYTSPIPLLHLS